MRKFWILLGFIFIIVFGLAITCAVSDPFKEWFGGAMVNLFGQTAVKISDWWTVVTANPLYQQWHMLIWFAGGVIGTVIFAKVLWPRRPKILGKTTTPSSLASTINLQREPAEPEPAPQAEPKKEEPPQAEQ